MIKFCQGDRTYLRPVQLSHAPLVIKWKQDPLVQKMALGPDVVVALESQQKDIKRAIDSSSELYLIIYTQQPDTPIGYIRINWMDDNHKFAWLRFALGEERGKGYAKDALKCFFQKLFEGNLHRVDAEVYGFNQTSVGLLQSLGFKKEGVKREAHFDGQSYFDIIVLGLLKKDFQNEKD